jgi:hypothetical protein
VRLWKNPERREEKRRREEQESARNKLSQTIRFLSSFRCRTHTHTETRKTSQKPWRVRLQAHAKLQTILVAPQHSAQAITTELHKTTSILCAQTHCEQIRHAGRVWL